MVKSRIINPTQPVMASYEEYIEEIKSIWSTKALTNNGEKVRKLKETLLKYVACENLDLFVNGHTALATAIKALNLKGEVITSPFTFVSTTNAIIQNGLTPVFCDIDDTYNLDVTQIEEYITENTCAIITPHIFGIPCNVDRIQEIAKKYNLQVIYDGAQAFGTKIGGRHIGCFGDVTMFSFHAIKIFNTIEGGMLCYRDKNLQSCLELYRNFGILYQKDKNDVQVCGWNGKMNEFQAAMGLVNLPYLDDEIEKRKKLAEKYIECFGDIPGLETYQYSEEISYNYAYFPVRIDSSRFGLNRDELWIELREKGVSTRKLYDVLTCDYSCYVNKDYVRNIGHAQKLAAVTLDFPLFGEMDEADVEYIYEVICTLNKKGRP